MRNPVTFSISEARKVQKKRQLRYIILLSAVVLLLLISLVGIRVLTMKKQADQLFPAESSSVAAGYSSGESTVTDESPATVNTAEPSPAGTEVSALTPEDDVFIPERVLLQTITHKERDSAYHQLQKDVQNLIDKQEGVRCGFYYLNLKSGEEFGYNDMLPFVVGSAVNLPINIMIYDQATTGGLSLTEIMTYEAADTVAGTGTIQNTPSGSQYSIRELSRLSISASDNTATSMILRRLGGIDIFNSNIKTISNVVDFRTKMTYTDFAGVQQSGMNRSSTQDLSKYMEYFYKMYLAQPMAYQPLFNDLAQTDSDSGAAANLSPEILVCHKSGINSTYNSQTDIALIFADEPYVICVAVESADPAAGKQLQTMLGDMVYTYLHACYS